MAAARRTKTPAVDPTASALAQGIQPPDDPDDDDALGAMLAEQQAAAEAMIDLQEERDEAPGSDPDPEAPDTSAILQDIVAPLPPSPNQKRTQRAQTGSKVTEVVGAMAKAIKDAGNSIPTQGERPMSIRRQRRIRAADVSVVQQLRQFGRPEGDLTGTATYWIRPGATIRDALIIYPNGGVPNIDDTQLAAKYGTNANYYRDRQLAKGYIFVGSTLTPQGIRTLIEVMEKEKPDEVLYLQEEIEIAEKNAEEAGKPEVRANELNRVRQLKRRLELVTKPIDVDEVVRDLDRIRRAQELAKLTPSMRAAISALFTQVLEELGPVAQMIAEGRGAASKPAELAGVAYGGEGVSAPDEAMVRGAQRERLGW